MVCKHGLPKENCGFCNPTKDVTFSASKFAAKHPDLDCDELAKKAAETMTPTQQIKMLVHLLKLVFAQAKRREIRNIEDVSFSSWELEKKERERERQVEYREAARERKALESSRPWTASYGPIAEDWKRRGTAWRKMILEKKEPEFARYLEQQGDKEYLGTGTYHSFNINRSYAKLEKTMREALTLEITEELLKSTFSLHNGKRVTWGEATAEDHQERIEALVSQASGTITTANRHREAIEMLERNHVSCLQELSRKEENAA